MLTSGAVVITLVSSLTPDDENVCATALMQHFVSVLRQLPIAYAIRIETVNQVLQHSAATGNTGAPEAGDRLAATMARSQAAAAPPGEALPAPTFN